MPSIPGYYRFAVLLLIVITASAPLTRLQAEPLHVAATNQTLNRVDNHLFGQFMEIASWGDPGPEALVNPKTGRLPRTVVQRLKQMHAPIIRYPGGTDVDVLDWTDRIDNVPGRNGPRPISERYTDKLITNHFGYDEFLHLAAQLHAQPLLAVNFGSVAHGPWTLKQGAAHAAALVDYCNGEVGAHHIGAGKIDWALIRKKNGRATPWNVKYWEIGNETYFYLHKAAKKHAARAGISIVEWIVRAVVRYANAMRAVDPKIRLFFDGKFQDAKVGRKVSADPRFKRAIDMVTLHKYQPGGIHYMSRQGERVQASELSEKTLWYAWVSMPAAYDAMGRTLAFKQSTIAARSGWSLASTEWNWNGWGGGINKYKGPSAVAGGLGAAGFLNGLLRQGGDVKLATQSTMLGTHWDIAAVHADPEGEHLPYITPTGLVTSLYSRYHGNRRLRVHTGSIASIKQNLTIHGWSTIHLHTPLPLSDIVATRDDQHLYLHVINRRLSAARTIDFNLAAVAASGSAETHTMVRKPPAERIAARDAMNIDTAALPVRRNRHLVLTLPAHSVCIVVVPLKQSGKPEAKSSIPAGRHK